MKTVSGFAPLASWVTMSVTCGPTARRAAWVCRVAAVVALKPAIRRLMPLAATSELAAVWAISARASCTAWRNLLNSSTAWAPRAVMTRLTELVLSDMALSLARLGRGVPFQFGHELADALLGDAQGQADQARRYSDRKSTRL